jgi:prepilin-type N-terminal cleavage/methylation domain-containing protein
MTRMSTLPRGASKRNAGSAPESNASSLPRRNASSLQTGDTNLPTRSYMSSPRRPMMSSSPTRSPISPAGVRGIDRRARHAARSGFTLLELMAVIVILGILIAVLMPHLGKAKEQMSIELTKTNLAEISAALTEYENQFGDYPPSTFLEKWGTPPNSTNLGAETLVLSLWSPDWSGTALSEDKLVNTDNDETKKPIAKFGKSSLFELADQWGNPVAYFHHRDYGRQDHYATKSNVTGETIDSVVKAEMNPFTKSYYNPKTYQLISAGPDGEFGTEDDIGNWVPKKLDEK